MSTVAEMLERFESIRQPGPYASILCHHHDGGCHGYHVVLGFITHGNEHGSLPAALRLVQDLKSGAIVAKGLVTVLLGNPEAAKADRRFLEEDLNRVFTFDRSAESHERRRAEAIRPLLDDAKLFLDFHQTQTPTKQAFWTFPWDPRFGQWARVVGGASVGLTRPPGQVFSAGTCCLDEYVRNRGNIGITVELGERGASEPQAKQCYESSLSLLQAVDTIETQQSSLEVLASTQPEMKWFMTQHIVPGKTTERRLRPGIVNWQEVSCGEELGVEGGPSIPAPADGVVLFPKYPPKEGPPPPELFRLGVPVTEELLAG